MADARVVQIVGDGLDGRWLTWRWDDPGTAGGVHETVGLADWTQRLRAALPIADGSNLSSLQLAGDLADADGELELMTGLAEALLPPLLREQLLQFHATGVPVHVRVAPSPAAGAVPWGLLPIDDDLRVLDVADVSWIAPILPRDLDTDADTPDWAVVGGLGALHVLDPVGHGHLPVLDQATSLPADLGTRSGQVVHQQTYTRRDLSRDLCAGVSRLFLLGHCVRLGSAGDTGFLLSDTPEFGVAGFDARMRRPLSAADLLRGTLNAAADQRPGADLWPMPPRVAVVACASGADMTDPEPFGFATALLSNGADTVHATLWTLPTDHALLQQDPACGHPFTQLALAVDAAQAAADPIRALCDWQRDRLDDWQGNPCLANAPIVWAAAMTMTAPVRRL